MIPFQQNVIHLVHFNDISVSPSRLNTSVLSTVLVRTGTYEYLYDVALLSALSECALFCNDCSDILMHLLQRYLWVMRDVCTVLAEHGRYTRTVLVIVRRRGTRTQLLVL